MLAALPRPTEVPAAAAIAAGATEISSSPADLPRPLETLELFALGCDSVGGPLADCGVVNDNGGVHSDAARVAQEVECFQADPFESLEKSQQQRIFISAA